MASAPQSLLRALLWKRAGEKVRCLLCPHFCFLSPGERGLCGVRLCADSAGGPRLETLVGDTVVSTHLDPVEKKPLYHFMPGTATWSFGTAGCNLSCLFCQNWSISRLAPDQNRMAGTRITPEQMVAEALALGASSISCTYTEPTVFFEYMSAVADRALEAKLANIMISNAFISPKALRMLEKRIQAANIDLKGFTEQYYRGICGASLKPVLRNLKAMSRMGWWLEITTLLVPGRNDSETELRGLARFIHNELGPHVPWHISRFRPQYRMRDLPPTPIESLERAWTIGKEEGLLFVYLGNVPGHEANSTYCPNCGALFAERAGFNTVLPGSSACKNCKAAIPGIGWGRSG